MASMINNITPYLDKDDFSKSVVKEATVCSSEIPEVSNTSILPTPIGVTMQGIEVLYDSILIALGLSLNLIIVILVIKFRNLRNFSFFIAVQVATVNIILTFVRTLPHLMNSAAGQCVFSLELCKLLGFALNSLCSVRILLVFAFSIDCFTTVFSPYWYPKYRQRIVSILSILAWFISILFFAVGILPGMDCYAYSEHTAMCPLSSLCSKKCYILYYSVLVLVVIPPVTIPAALFLIMYIKGRKIRKTEALVLGLEKKTISDRDWRAIKTFLLLFFGICIIIFVPFIIFEVSKVLGILSRTLLDKLSFGIIFSHIITDPILIMRNADIKESLYVLMNKFKKFSRRLCKQNSQH